MHAALVRHLLVNESGFIVMQKSERPGVFVGILRAGLGPFLQQAAGLLLTRTESTKVCPSCVLCFCPCCM